MSETKPREENFEIDKTIQLDEDLNESAEKLTEDEIKLRELMRNNMPPSIVLDLDGTICFPNLQYEDSERRYGEARPNKPLIRKLRELADKEYMIIIHTSRRMKTHNGDIAMIVKDVGEITQEWLEDMNVPYHTLIFGKPLATTYYVDDKAMRPDEFIDVADSLEPFTPPDEVIELIRKIGPANVNLNEENV